MFHPNAWTIDLARLLKGRLHSLLYVPLNNTKTVLFHYHHVHFKHLNVMLKTPRKRRHIETMTSVRPTYHPTEGKATGVRWNNGLQSWTDFVVILKWGRKLTHEKHMPFSYLLKSSKIIRLQYKMTWNSIKTSSTSIPQHEDIEIFQFQLPMQSCTT